ncbi:MAG: hypothetical protein QW303_03090 [Nitrososphaerota archaeon]
MNEPAKNVNLHFLNNFSFIVLHSTAFGKKLYNMYVDMASKDESKGLLYHNKYPGAPDLF